MELAGKNIVITGAGSGIGRAMAYAFKAEGAAHITVADLNEAGARETATHVGGTALKVDVTKEDDIRNLVRVAEAAGGPIDLFCSNAGVIDLDPEFDNAASAPDALWQRALAVHVMAHVYAARILLPKMMARKSGYFLNTVSAAGLLSQIGSATYSTSKHAAIGFAESLAIASKDHGIGVSLLCPQAVATPLAGTGDFHGGADVDGVISADACAKAAVDGLRAEQFIILPHPAVLGYMQAKTANYDRWIGGMVKLRRRIAEAGAEFLAEQAKKRAT